MGARVCPKCGLPHGADRRKEYRQALIDGLRKLGVELSAEEASFLTWLAGFDVKAVSTLLCVFGRCVQAGRRSLLGLPGEEQQHG